MKPKNTPLSNKYHFAPIVPIRKRQRQLTASWDDLSTMKCALARTSAPEKARERKSSQHQLRAASFRLLHF